MPVWLAPIAGKAAWVVGVLLGGLLIYWLIRRSVRREERAEAKARDASIRGEAARASQEGYIAERERQAKLDPITGKPLPPPGGVQ